MVSVHGVHCIPVPTAFPIGDVNAFLVEGDPLTLIDSGPDSASSLSALERGLAEAGFRVEDLDLLIVTHQHSDHLGLTEALVERSGAEVACLEELVPYARDFLPHAGADDDLAFELMVAHGVDVETARSVRNLQGFIRHYGCSFEVTRPFRDGDVLEAGGRRLRALRRPGHSPSDTILVDEEAGIAFGGDHLLARTSSIATVSRPLDGAPSDARAHRPHALGQYLDSLRDTRELGLDTIFPGHGELVDGIERLVERRLAFHDERADAILDVLREAPATGRQVAHRLFEQVAVVEPVLTTFEVVGHLDLLVDRGLVEEEVVDDVSVFAFAGDAR